MKYSDESPAYDSMGNLTSIEGWTLAYSPLGQLVSASKTGSAIQKYAYDAFGNRAYEESSGNYTRNLLYVGNQLFDSCEMPSAGGAAVIKSYVFGPGIDHPIAEIAGNAANINYLLQDANGNVVALIDSTGAVTERYTYDAWGTPKVYDASWSTLTSAPQSRFLFTGRDYDSATGLYHYRTRAYSPKLGRFLQSDTIDFRGGDLNIYTYVSNNPICRVDPLGTEVGDWWDFSANYRRANEIAREELSNHHGHNNRDDAMRHAVWSQRMAKELGTGYAAAFGTGHELDSLVHGGPLNEIFMDLHNNAVGRDSKDGEIDEDDLQNDPIDPNKRNESNYDPSKDRNLTDSDCDGEPDYADATPYGL